MTRAAKATWIARCPGCRAHRRIERGDVVAWWNGRPSIACECGRSMGAKLLKGFVTDHECDARCMGAKGHVCECSCGGANHGVAA